MANATTLTAAGNAQAGNGTFLRSATPLTDEQIMQIAPSVFAAEPHESRGERYAFIPTSDVLTALRREGFQPYAVGQSRCRDHGKREHTKHLIRLRHGDMGSVQSRQVGDVTPEVVIINSHDGTSSYQISAGLYRLVCSNGMMVATPGTEAEIRIRHSGRIADDVIEGSFQIVGETAQIAQRVERLADITLTAPEQELFARSASTLKWEEGQAPFNPVSLLTARRWEDKKDDLWTTLNRVQENMLKGGLRGRGTTGRRMTTRGVTSINEDTRLNRSLWMLAEQFADLKLAA